MTKNLFFIFILALACWSCSDDQSISDKPDTNTHPDEANYHYVFGCKSNLMETKAIGIKSKYWPCSGSEPTEIKIQFIIPDSLRDVVRTIYDTHVLPAIMECAGEWSKYANVKFLMVESDPDIIVGINYENDKVLWAKIGTDGKRETLAGKPAVNLVLYNANRYSVKGEVQTETFKGSVYRAFGHVLGLVNETRRSEIIEQLSISEFYSYYRALGWSNEWIEETLTWIDLDETNYTEFDAKSIMTLDFPKQVFKDMTSLIRLNVVLSETDKRFIAEVYPKSTSSTKKLVYTFNNNDYEYNAIKIGEYYWMDRNFDIRVPRISGTEIGRDSEEQYDVTMERLETYFSCYNLDISYYENADINDFHKHYGMYYNRASVDYMLQHGYMAEGENKIIRDWGVPNVDDFRQLFAMCPMDNLKKDTLSIETIRYGLGANIGANPLCFNWEQQNNAHVYWFTPKSSATNTYGFNMMPGGAKLNGGGLWWNSIKDPEVGTQQEKDNSHYGKTGDIYHLFYAAGFHANDMNKNRACQVYVHDYVTIDFSYYWYNARLCRRLTDNELGYKLYIDNSKTNIVKLGLDESPASGYNELPNGYLRGLYVQYILDNPNPMYTISDLVNQVNAIHKKTDLVIYNSGANAYYPLN